MKKYMLTTGAVTDNNRIVTTVTHVQIEGNHAAEARTTAVSGSAEHIEAVCAGECMIARRGLPDRPPCRNHQHDRKAI